MEIEQVVEKDATLSKCGRYRYELIRRWGPGSLATFVMLNPSKADHKVDDPTVRKCMKFARKWGYSGIRVVNLFAWRATDPAALKKVPREDLVGPYNNDHILHACKSPGMVVLAWGAHGGLHGRDQEVIKVLQEKFVDYHHLGRTKHGLFRHPLFIRDNTYPFEGKE